MPEQEISTDTKGGPGRPRKEPTKMATVNIPSPFHSLSAPELSQKIEDWLDAINVDELVLAAAKRAMVEAQDYHQWRPYKFQVKDHWLPSAKKLADKEPENPTYTKKIKAFKKSFRMTVALDGRIKRVAAQLNTKPSDVIRLALAEAFIEHGTALIDQGFTAEWPNAIVKTLE